MHRRTLLTVAPTSVIALSALLAACSGAPGATTPADVIAKGVNIGKALDVMLGQFHAAYPTILTDDVYAKIETNVQLAEMAATQLAAGMPAATGASVINQVVGYITAALGPLTQPPLSTMIPPPYETVIQAAAFTIPLLVAFASVYVTPTAAPVAMKAGVKPMSTDGAGSVLATWAAKK